MAPEVVGTGGGPPPVPGYRPLGGRWPPDEQAGPTTLPALDAATGAPVTLTLVAAPADPVVRARLRRAAGQLAAAAAEELEPVSRALTVPEGLVLVTPADGVALTEVVAGRRLQPGHVAGVVAAAARGVAALHRRGLRHGSVGPAAIVVAPDGRPRLAGAGVGWLRALAGGAADEPTLAADFASAAAGDPTPAAADLAGLAGLAAALGGVPAPGPGDWTTEEQVAAWLRAGAAPLPLPVAWVRHAVDRRAHPQPVPAPLAPAAGAARRSAGEPVSRPSACPAAGSAAGPAAEPVAEPVRVPRAAARARPPRRLAPPRRLLSSVSPPAVLAVVGAILAGWAGVTQAHSASGADRVVRSSLASGSSPAARVPATVPAAGPPGAAAGWWAPTAARWTAVVATLDAARAAALAAPDGAVWTAVDAPGSPALAADRRVGAALAADGVHAIGLRWSLLLVRRVAGRGAIVRLLVVDRMAPYRLADATGRPVATRPGRAAAAWSVLLRSTTRGWRVFAVWAGAGPAPVPSSSAAP